MPKDKKKQLQIAAEVIEAEQLRRLRSDIKFLRRMPKDFRDITTGLVDWERFAAVTNRQEEMTKWSRGLVLCLEEPNDLEKRVLGKIRIFSQKIVLPRDWLLLFRIAEADCVSYIYLPNEEGEFIQALNIVLSRMGANFRIKGQLLSAHSGKPLGVIH